jgi:hypothetical protein
MADRPPQGSGGQGSWGGSIGVRKLLLLNHVLIVLGAWLVSLPGIAGALALSIPVALIGARYLLIAGPAKVGMAAALIGGVTGSVLFGDGSLVIRVALGVGAGSLVLPMVIPVLLLRWYRVHLPHAPVA